MTSEKPADPRSLALENVSSNTYCQRSNTRYNGNYIKIFTAFLVFLLIWGIACPNLGIASDASQKTTLPNVLLIGWDGAGRTRVLQLLQDGQLPTLAELASNGSLVEINVKGVTDSVAGWSEILSGCTPEVTRIVSGSDYEPFRPALGAFARLKNIYSMFGESLFCAAILAKAGSFGDTNPPTKEYETTNPPPAKSTTSVQVRRSSTDDHSNRGGVAQHLWHTLDAWHSNTGANSNVARLAIELMQSASNKPFFIFVHFAEADNAGHKYGEQSTNYLDAIKANDYYSGELISALKKAGLFQNTVICITADHGFDRGAKTHLSAREVFLAMNKRGLRGPGTRADVLPTILDAVGVLHLATNQPLSGVSLLSHPERTSENPATAHQN